VLQRTVLEQHPAQYSLKLMVGQKQLVNQEREKSWNLGRYWNILSSRIISIFFFVIIFSETPQIVPFSFGSDVINEGDVAQLTCLVKRGDEPLKITWFLKGDVISSESSMTTTMIGTKASMLMISDVGYRNSGTYTCKATNDAGSQTMSSTLKVNGITRFKETHEKGSKHWLNLLNRNFSKFLCTSPFQNHLSLYHLRLAMRLPTKEILSKSLAMSSVEMSLLL